MSVYSKPVLEFLSFNLYLISEIEIRDHKTYFYKLMLLDMCRNAGYDSFEIKYFQIGMNIFLKAVKKK